MKSLLLATFELLPDGEPGGDLLVDALARRGVAARWAVWTDPTVDWAAADAVAVRSTWDYHRRLTPFLAWARDVESKVPLLNGADVFAWNCDKSYLVDLAEQVPVVPTSSVADDDLLAGLRRGLAEHGTVLIKPRVGAGGVGVVVAERTDDQRLAHLSPGPWLVQPLVDSVRTDGETSVFVLGGRAVSQVHKLPGGTEVRVHEEYGGVSRPVALDDTAADLAVRTLAVVEERFGRSLPYGRVDLLRYDGELVVSEVELIEPGLYLDVFPQNADAFAEVVAGG
jgi:glutathione synthase/RimK-type ligase-like ATP-grasp enzyme